MYVALSLSQLRRETLNARYRKSTPLMTGELAKT